MLQTREKFLSGECEHVETGLARIFFTRSIESSIMFKIVKA
jgi:hypothetical protein